jgi:diamine N-acetyltransferase
MRENGIILRAPEPEDLEILYRWENDPEVWPVSNTLVPFSRYLLKQYLENTRHDIFELKQARFMIDLKEGSSPAVTIGTIDLFQFDPLHLRAGVGILIKEQQHRRKGYAGQALDLLLDYCFNTLQLHQVFCNITEGNEASIRLFRSRGFVETGRKKEWIRKNGKWMDELFFQLLASSRMSKE